MKTLLTFLVIVSSAAAADQIPNRLIDYPEFKKIVFDSVLDARSASKYALRHVRGAVNLPFTDFTADTLAQVIPSKTTKILIYCNNNFEGSATAFPSKAPAASLNLSTSTSLRAYGYTNIFELGPLLDVNETSIPFDGTEVK